MLLGKLPASERESHYAGRLARWRWQYYANPGNPDGEPLIWVAEVDGEFGGMVATIPVRVRTPKGPVLGMWGVDFIVSGKMRGLGIGKKLLIEWIRTPGIAFVMGWSPVSFKVAQGVGFDVMWGFTTADILLSRVTYTAEQVRHRQRARLRKLARVLPRLNPRHTGHRGKQTRVEPTLPDGTGDLWEKVREAYPFAVERDQAYLKWRFEDHPTHEYRYVCVGEPGSPSAVGICRLTDAKPPLGVVADLLADPADGKMVSDLVDGVIGFLKSQGAYAARMDLPPALAHRILARYRCTLTDDRGIIVRTETPDLKGAGILAAPNWYISRSDADEDY
jgi:GNAT superfamily N-acetyltransferase